MCDCVCERETVFVSMHVCVTMCDCGHVLRCVRLHMCVWLCVWLCVILRVWLYAYMCRHMPMFGVSTWIDRKGGKGKMKGIIILVICSLVDWFFFYALHEPYRSHRVQSELRKEKGRRKHEQETEGEEEGRRRWGRDRKKRKEAKETYLGETTTWGKTEVEATCGGSECAPTCGRQSVTDLLGVINTTICLISDWGQAQPKEQPFSPAYSMPLNMSSPKALCAYNITPPCASAVGSRAPGVTASKLRTQRYL